jgi:hypothetical protein
MKMDAPLWMGSMLRSHWPAVPELGPSAPKPLTQQAMKTIAKLAVDFLVLYFLLTQWTWAYDHLLIAAVIITGILFGVDALINWLFKSSRRPESR